MSEAPTTPDPVGPPPETRTDQPRRRWGRWALGILLTVMLLAGALFGGGWWYLSRWGDTPSGDPGDRSITIPSGTSARRIARLLADEGLVSHPGIYLLWLKREGKLTALNAGEYRLQAPITPRQLTARLGRGSFQRRLTIPEGWTARRIGKKLAAEKWIESENAWHELLQDPGPLPADFVSLTGVEPSTASLSALPDLPLEGFLFPDTYMVEAGSPPRALLHSFLQEFARQWQSARPADRVQPARNMTVRQIVTLASLVQCEARSEAEMPLIASVYYNRLARRMKLQCDATIHYALGDVWDRKLTYRDLKVESPYNTYLHHGLPPGPIANPGRAAIEAALRPAETGFLYYVYGGGSQHVFSRTWREHQRAVRAARQNAPSP